ncbi:MAG: hypothetical protein WCV67_20015 [Victivallaceae bacterium]
MKDVMLNWTLKSEWESPRVREWKVESEKSGKLGIGKCRADVQNVDMVYAQEHSKGLEMCKL